MGTNGTDEVPSCALCGNTDPNSLYVVEDERYLCGSCMVRIARLVSDWWPDAVSSGLEA